MYNLDNKIKQQYYNFRNGKDLFRDEDGAIDLASIMVGVIVIGLIGGVIAATVFTVIPWAQDNAAKQQLDSIVQAENAYFGLSAANPSPLPAGTPANSFGKSAELKTANLLTTGSRYCVTTPDDSKSYTGYSQSSSGTIFTVNDKNSKPEPLVIPSGTKAVDSLPADCQFITVGITEPATVPSSTPTPPAPYVDPTPTLTKFTFQCDSPSTTAYLPMTAMQGTLTWSDGTTIKFTGQGNYSRALVAGQKYTVTFDGTYPTMNALGAAANPCLRSMDYWGSNTGATSAVNAFANAANLVSVPEHIPATVTDMTAMFKNATSFNSSNISNWDVSNVMNTTGMFNGAKSFNQSLNNWKLPKVTNLSLMFNGATSFNQPLNNWNVSNVTDMVMMFNGADAYNQDLSSWDTSKVKSMGFMFGSPNTMKNNVKNNTNNIATIFTFQSDVSSGSAFLPMTAMQGTLTWSDGTTIKFTGQGNYSRSLVTGQKYTVIFEGTYPTMNALGAAANPHLRSMDYWGSSTGVTSAVNAFANAANLVSVPDNVPATVTDMTAMFKGATSFNSSNISNWDVSNVMNTTEMFSGAKSFNQSLNNWNLPKVTNLSLMFNGATSFNQPLNNWNVSNVTDMVMMFNGADAYNQDLSSWDTSRVKSMGFMFGSPNTMKNNVKNNTNNIATIFTFQSDVSSGNAYIPMTAMQGTLTWSDGTKIKYSGQSGFTKALVTGQKYTVIFEGTYTSMNYLGAAANPHLRSMDYWGSSTGVTSAVNAFANTANLVSVPDNVPATVTDMTAMFKNATSFNSSNVKNWDVSKVTNMSSMFAGATSFNQDLSGWNTAALTNGTLFAPTSFPDAYMPAKTSK